MQKITVITMGVPTGEAIQSQLTALLKGKVTVETRLASEVERPILHADLLLFSSEALAKVILKSGEPSIPWMVARRVINHRNIGDVISLPRGSRVLLVNDFANTAREARDQLVEIGLDHIEYLLYSPGSPLPFKAEVVITPGEVDLVPYPPRRLINIGSRILDVQSIHGIVQQLGLEDVFTKSVVTGYLKDIVTITHLIEEKRRTALASEKQLEAVFNSVDTGLIHVDEEGRVVNLNQRGASLMGKKRKDLLYQPLDSWLPLGSNPLTDGHSWISDLEGRECLFEVRKISFDDRLGYLITVGDGDQISKWDHTIRRSRQKSMQRKRHDFQDYLTLHPAMKLVLKRARQFARTDATILIQGENGTGKEILAQAIHQHSLRKREAFVPVNIAAVSPSLLESELFGYEEGSFTGALKGGKRGLFEIASGGTIFIDEIGEAPLSFQVKLLRVLEEKRIRRVGALEEIPVDVRVIAATNRNLMQMVDQGAFREDLFFRLNILPLKTIPLRHRREDIPYLLQHFCRISFGRHHHMDLTDLFEAEALAFLEQHRWRGNVRELMNLVEYLSLIYEGERIGMEALYGYLPTDKQVPELPLLNRDEYWVLNQIDSCGGTGVGRKMLANLAEEQAYPLGEGKIRRLLMELTEKELLASAGSHQGCHLTRKGAALLQKWRNVGAGMDESNQ
ncbi:sigma-54 interaction domain-containing protein [Anoxynatronum sibiricum]|uniref:Sigma 54-interacting transcriptional regulator n=1 Tax=Anoxynatronum sibiricum TaxID=210623 RepID=A0ABU9VVX9_9CLOT